MTSILLSVYPEMAFLYHMTVLLAFLRKSYTLSQNSSIMLYSQLYCRRLQLLPYPGKHTHLKYILYIKYIHSIYLTHKCNIFLYNTFNIH